MKKPTSITGKASSRSEATRAATDTARASRTLELADLDRVTPDRKRYHVFLSHRYVDKDDVAALKRHIERDLGYTVYVDWLESPGLDRSKVTQDTAEYLRRTMRRCNCLLFYVGSDAPGSKWMPWELGFFDGRQGSRRIAIYHRDDKVTPAQQEYLSLYRSVDRDSLPAFLAEAADDTAAMTSATYDQAARHIEQMTSRPLDYLLSVMQWQYGVAANLLLDPANVVVMGDGQPTGPVREPAALFTPTYEALRAMQAEFARLREASKDLDGNGLAHATGSIDATMPRQWMQTPLSIFMGLWGWNRDRVDLKDLGVT